jgi:uncharacterized protein with von Willebrand factor type A (vWA) domain
MSAKERRQEELDTELERFVEYGAVLDRRTREYLAAHLRSRVLGEPLPATLDQRYAAALARALDEVFGTADTETDTSAGAGRLLGIVRQNSAMGMQVGIETVRWMRRAWRRLETEDPHAEERSRLGAVAAMPLRHAVGAWRSPLAYLRRTYAAHELDVDFYEEALVQAIRGRPPGQLEVAALERVDALLHDLLVEWDARLSAKRLDNQLTQLAQSAAEFQTRLRDRLDQHQRLRALLAPFSEYIGRSWDLSRDLWEEADLDLLAEYQALLDDEQGIRELAELLGRLRQAALDSEDEELSRTIVRVRWERDPTARAEIVGVHESGDLELILPSETALLAEPATEALFYQKVADRRLLSWRHEHREKVVDPLTITETFSKTKRREQGPFIVCVDTSYSMAGRPELLAKVLVFGIARIAAEQGRSAYLINFSVSIQTIDLVDLGQSLPELAAFLRMSFHGGTDLTLALHEALRMLETERYREADVLLVSDFVMFQVHEHLLESIRRQQHNADTRFHGLTLSDQPPAPLMDVMDTAWQVEPEGPTVVTRLAGVLGDLAGG